MAAMMECMWVGVLVAKTALSTVVSTACYLDLHLDSQKVTLKVESWAVLTELLLVQQMAGSMVL